MTKNVNIEVSDDSKTVYIGDAPDLPAVKGYAFSGNIYAPAEYAESYAQNYIYKVAEVNYGLFLGSRITPSKVTLRLGYDSSADHVVTGTLDIHPVLAALSLGQKKPHRAFVEHLRMFRAYYLDMAEYSSVMESINKLQVSVNIRMAEDQDKRGNKSKDYSKAVYTQIASSFQLLFPLFNGVVSPKTASVDICYEHSDAGMMFWLESAEIEDLLAKESRYFVDEVMVRLSEVGITILEV